MHLYVFLSPTKMFSWESSFNRFNSFLNVFIWKLSVPIKQQKYMILLIDYKKNNKKNLNVSVKQGSRLKV